MYAHLHEVTYTHPYMHNFMALWCATTTEQKRPCTSLMWNEVIWLAYSPMTHSRRYFHWNIVQITKSLICHQRVPATDTHYDIYKLVWFIAVSVSVKLEFGWGHHTSGVWHSFETPFSELKLLSPTEHSRNSNSFSLHTLLLRYLNGDIS